MRSALKQTNRNLIYLMLVILSLYSCSQDDAAFREMLEKPEHLHRSMKAFTNVIIHDIFSPPQASRNYVYPSIAAYEVFAAYDSTKFSLRSQIEHMPTITPESEEIYPELASLEAFLITATHFVFSEDSMRDFRSELYDKLKKDTYNKKKWEASLQYGKEVATEIVKWSDADNYKQSRSFPKFTITDEPHRWKPTPPAYMEGIEPSWRTIRPMVLDSAQQFKPLEPTPFDMTEGSQFYQEVQEVYTTVKEANHEKQEIASFWDCNPYVMNLTGHVMYASKKITPGGHWMGITGIASAKAGDTFAEAARSYALVAMGLFDGFISCWDEKYRSNLIRPETVINEHIDPTWTPLLQTPPFPEYTSGHSVISTAAAVILTDIYGDSFSFDDSVELEYGLPIRSFESFNEAAAEAAISRLYGGIHYMPAIANGQVQGRAIGEMVIKQNKI